MIVTQFFAPVVAMAGAKRQCVSCGNGFIGTVRARYCSPACKQRAHRGRKGSQTVAGVTVTPPPGERGHCAEAVALAESLYAEMAENAEHHGQELELPAAERAVLEMVLCAVDRKVDLWSRYWSSEDDKVRVGLATELRLTERAIEAMLRQVHTDLPSVPSRVSQKASQAANSRWGNGAG